MIEVKAVTKVEKAKNEMTFEDKVILQLQQLNSTLSNIDQRVDEVCDRLINIENYVNNLDDDDLDFDDEDDDADDEFNEIRELYDEQLRKEAEIFGMPLEEYKEKMHKIDELNNDPDGLKRAILNRVMIDIIDEHE